MAVVGPKMPAKLSSSQPYKHASGMTGKTGIANVAGAFCPHMETISQVVMVITPHIQQVSSI